MVSPIEVRLEMAYPEFTVSTDLTLPGFGHHCAVRALWFGQDHLPALYCRPGKSRTRLCSCP